jgi:hypothetical protein
MKKLEPPERVWCRNIANCYSRWPWMTGRARTSYQPHFSETMSMAAGGAVDSHAGTNVTS